MSFSTRPTFKHLLLPFILLFSLLNGSHVFAKGSLPKSMPSDLSKVDFHLITVGNGPDLYMRYGHTIVRMIDRNIGKDYNLNWGIFNFADPNFALNFFLGTLNYRLGGMSYSWLMKVYGQYEKRYVYIQKINFTESQKRRFIERILWNVKPENLNYKYNHFYNNCSTKPRDYIDEALGGVIKQRYEKETVAISFRDYVREHMNRTPYLATSLDLSLNGTVDFNISKWQEMFFPEKLSEYLTDFPAIDDTGKPIVGTNLLSKRQMLVDHPTYSAYDFNFYIVYLWLFGIPLLILLIHFVNVSKKVTALASWSYKLLAIISLIYGVFAGAHASFMATAWAFSEHKDLYHNYNLLFMWPVDWFYLYFGIALLVKKTTAKLSAFTRIAATILSAVHVLFIGLYYLLFLLSMTSQDVSRVMLYIAPLSGLFFVMIFLWNRTQQSENG